MNLIIPLLSWGIVPLCTSVGLDCQAIRAPYGAPNADDRGKPVASASIAGDKLTALRIENRLSQPGASSAVGKIDSLMRRAHELGLFNGNVLVAEKGKVVYTAALGFADAGQQARLTEQHRFHIGSIAKEFNAVGIMLLAQQGKLKLDDKVAKYLPQLPAWANTVTIRHLLQYTSGLPQIKWSNVSNDDDNLRALMQLQQLEAEPGSRYAYNNNDVFLQRRVIEKVSGLPFDRFVEQQLLKPVGIKQAVVDPTDQTPLMAKSYDQNRKQDKLIYPISGWTALTLADFYRWEQAVVNGKILGPEAIHTILFPATGGRQAGLGGGTMEGQRVTSHVHDGTTMNYQALVTSAMPQKRTVILLTNNRNLSLYKFNTAIQAILDGKSYQHPKKPVLSDFKNRVDSLGGPSFLAFYQTLKASKLEVYAFEDESTLNEVGYYFLGKNRVADAISVFAYNTELFPQSGNVFDSLGEAYYKQGDKAQALLNYQRALQLDPTNATAKRIVSELGK